MPRSTKEAIVSSLYGMLKKKSFEKITVKDIVEDCGINRKTFYYYFKDIYDLVEYIFRVEIDRYISGIPEDSTLAESISGIFELVESNRKVVYHLSESNDSELKKYLYGAFYDTVFKKYKAKAAEFGVSERDYRLLCEVFVMAFSGMITTWLDGGMKPEYKDDIKRVCAMLGGSAENMLENIKKISETREV